MKVLKWSARPVTIPATPPAINASRPSQFDFCCEWQADEPVAVDLQLSLHLKRSPGSGFPPRDHQSYPAGALNGEQCQMTGSYVGLCVIKIELGSGPDARVLFADCKAGRFSLGPQTYVRVSASRWFTTVDGGGIDSTLQAAVGSHADGSAEYLTFTAIVDPASVLATHEITVPPGACWFEVYPADDADLIEATLYGDPAAAAHNPPPVVKVLRDFGGPDYRPPFSPIPINGNLVSFNPSGAGGSIVFWVK